MTETAETALRRLADLWERERRAERARFHEERQRTSLAERVAAGWAMRDVHIEDTDAAPGGRLLVWLESASTTDAVNLRLSPGDPVRLFWERPDEPDAVRGVVSRRRDARLGVAVSSDLPERFEDPGFRVERDPDEATFDRGARALADFRLARRASARARLREVLFGHDEPRFDDRGVVEPLDPDLNEPQLEAVAHALAARDVALIHGPPGTGKTRTLVEVIRQAVRGGERVLASAPSNTAVDNLAERLAQAGVEVVRLGHPARVAAPIVARTLDVLLQSSAAYRLARSWLDEANALRRRAAGGAGRKPLNRSQRRALWRDARQLTRDANRHLASTQQAILERADVLCATAAGADTALLSDWHFDTVVLDEATQAVDPVALVAFARAERVILAGDPHQLPPTVIDPDAARDGLSQTRFEALYQGRHDQTVRLLRVQHRMNERLMVFPSLSKYDSQLVAAASVAQHTLDDLAAVAPDEERPGPLLFIDTAGKGWSESRDADESVFNRQQAELVTGEARRLVQRGVSPSDLAVIAAYRAQVQLLRQQLGDLLDQGLEVDTVDGFQGREKEAVIVDLVRSNDDAEIGFLSETRRMNVALTRARRFLLVVGDSATLGNHRYYQQFFEVVESGGHWLSAWHL